MSDIAWKILRDKAIQIMCNAYDLRLRFPVGAAALSSGGRIVSGCNVENVSIARS
ncbi:hypothetical protein [Nocardia nepalensis]|uniref:hypothetical protein n=1 Tax=Nocardia nepalensis TaxID=3375448 RepID=UPI003B66FF85